jgi:hypothetical protein
VPASDRTIDCPSVLSRNRGLSAVALAMVSAPSVYSALRLLARIREQPVDPAFVISSAKSAFAARLLVTAYAMLFVGYGSYQVRNEAALVGGIRKVLVVSILVNLSQGLFVP